MNVAIDYDGTITADPMTFYMVARLFKAAGHKVYIVTMRYREECNHIPNEWLALVDGLYCTGSEAHGDRLAKNQHMLAHGIRIHVWIDDNPRAVNESAKQIWGSASPKGTVVEIEYPDNENAEPIHNTRVLGVDSANGQLASCQGHEHSTT